MCQALRDATAAYCIPLTSGKDSMKNDFKADGVTSGSLPGSYTDFTPPPNPRVQAKAV